eukprot:14518-Heterococcus_DN1.PRE.1
MRCAATAAAAISCSAAAAAPLATTAAAVAAAAAVNRLLLTATTAAINRSSSSGGSTSSTASPHVHTSCYKGRAQRALVHLSEGPCCNDRANADLQWVQLKVAGRQPGECLLNIKPCYSSRRRRCYREVVAQVLAGLSAEGRARPSAALTAAASARAAAVAAVHCSATAVSSLITCSCSSISSSSSAAIVGCEGWRSQH